MASSPQVNVLGCRLGDQAQSALRLHPLAGSLQTPTRSCWRWAGRAEILALTGSPDTCELARAMGGWGQIRSTSRNDGVRESHPSQSCEGPTGAGHDQRKEKPSWPGTGLSKHLSLLSRPHRGAVSPGARADGLCYTCAVGSPQCQCLLGSAGQEQDSPNPTTPREMSGKVLRCSSPDPNLHPGCGPGCPPSQKQEPLHWGTPTISCQAGLRVGAGTSSTCAHGTHDNTSLPTISRSPGPVQYPGLPVSPWARLP